MDDKFVSALAQRNKRIPALAAFEAAANRILAAGDDRRFWDCEGPFSELLNTPFLADLVNDALGQLLGNPAYLMPGHGTETSLLSAKGAFFSLTFKIVEPDSIERRWLYSSCSHSMTALYQPGEASVSFQHFRQPQPEANAVFDRTKRLEVKPPAVLAEDVVIRAEAGVDVFGRETPTAPVILASLTSRAVLPLVWEYDANTLFPARAMSGSVAASRVQYACKLLGEMCNPAAIPSLRPLLKHPEHFVRWSAAQAILKTDISEGWRALEALAEDDHPHIRAAVARESDKILMFFQSTKTRRETT